MEIRKFNKETDSFEELSDLYRLGLGDSPSSYWKWKYGDKTGFGSQEMFVITEDEKIIAMMGYIPMNYRDKDGKIHVFAQLCDLVVHPDHRGGGKFYAITKEMKEDAIKKGYEGFYIFPNKNSAHGFAKMGFVISDIYGYDMKKNPGRIIAHKLGLGRKLKKTNYRVEIHNENIGSFADKIDKNEKWLTSDSVCLDVNKDFIKWRCDDYIYGNYKSICLYDEKKLVAYFVVLVTEGRLKTAVKVVNFDIQYEYMTEIETIAEDFRKAAYTIGDTIDFYGVWGKELRDIMIKGFSLQGPKELEGSDYGLLLFEGIEKPEGDLFIGHIDTDL